MTEELLKRADFYFLHQRYVEAEKEYRNLISMMPDNAYVYCRLAICCAYNEKLSEAQGIAAKAVTLDPEFGYSYYICAFLNNSSGSVLAAHRYIDRAISLEIENADYHGLKSNIFMREAKWSDALDSADKGLSFDPENLTCINARTTALTKLNRKEEAHESIAEALHYDPNDSRTHTNVGWSFLENGDHSKALDHFRMALRINPENEYARSGIIESLKARSWLYRMWLKYVFWSSNLSSQTRTILFIGLFIFMRILANVDTSNSILGFLITPILVIYMFFAFSTWIVEPISNLILRLNRFGRFALSEEETKVSNAVGVSLLIGAIGLVLWLVTDAAKMGMLAIIGVSMMIPLSSWYRSSSARGKKTLRTYTITLGIIGLMAVIVPYSAKGDISFFFALYVVGIIIYSWVASGIISSYSNR